MLSQSNLRSVIISAFFGAFIGFLLLSSHCEASIGSAIGSLLVSDDCIEPPKECPNKDITFHLYSRVIDYQEYIMDVNDPSTIVNAPLTPNCPLKFLLHGYTGHKDYTPNMEIRPAYFQHPDPVNIVSIDYGRLVREGCYIAAVNNAPLVAQCAAQFLDLFFELRPDTSLEQLHVIGMSLGAQVAGQLKNYFKRGTIPRITGLDAAMPLFFSYLVSTKNYLNKGDGGIVDLIHTNAAEKGKLLPQGDIDFYANDGTHQPQCKGNSSCSHAASAVYYAESINSPLGFWGRGCSFFTRILGFCGDESKKWNLFGEFTNLEIHGTFYFKTNKQPPYARGIEGGLDD